VIKSTVLYGHPQDPEEFERHYAKSHLPLIEKLPSVQRIETALVLGTPDETPAPYYRIAELWFATPEEMEASLTSPEGQATVADMQSFATGGATILVAQVD
jgi:uncharacterized protein (TIGR02118 family)